MGTNQIRTNLGWKLVESFKIICENTKHLDMPQSWKMPLGSLAAGGFTPSSNWLVFHLILCFKVSLLLFSHPQLHFIPGGVLFPLLTTARAGWAHRDTAQPAVPPHTASPPPPASSQPSCLLSHTLLEAVPCQSTAALAGEGGERGWGVRRLLKLGRFQFK